MQNGVGPNSDLTPDFPRLRSFSERGEEPRFSLKPIAHAETVAGRLSLSLAFANNPEA